jgi:hypothetical protein
MTHMFQKQSFSDFVPQSRNFEAYEFTKIFTKKRSRLFRCTHRGCNKTKVSISKLFSHIISHSQDKPYICQYDGCSMSFGYLGNYRKHIYDAHGEKYIS